MNESEFMKKFFLASVFAISLSGAAQAASVTINFEAANLYGSGLSLLGLSAGDSLTGSFTYNDALPDSQQSYANSLSSYDDGYDFDSSMSVTIGGTTYTGSVDNTVQSRDGIADGTVDIFDYFVSYAEGLFNSLPGIVDSSGYVVAYDVDESIWSGLARSAEELDGAQVSQLVLTLTPDTGSSFEILSDNVTFSSPDLTPVPLPAGGALLLAGLGALAFLRRRKV